MCVCVVCNLTHCVDGGQVGLGLWQLKNPQTVTFKHYIYIFLSHLLVCVRKLHELYFMIEEDKFLLPIHAHTQPHSCAVCTCWCACDLERECFITALPEAQFLTDFPVFFKTGNTLLTLWPLQFSTPFM
jgi:hypothetical protein